MRWVTDPKSMCVMRARLLSRRTSEDWVSAGVAVSRRGLRVRGTGAQSAVANRRLKKWSRGDFWRLRQLGSRVGAGLPGALKGRVGGGEPPVNPPPPKGEPIWEGGIDSHAAPNVRRL